MNRKLSRNIKIAVDAPVKRKKEKTKTTGRRERYSPLVPREPRLGSYFCVIAWWCVGLFAAERTYESVCGRVMIGK